MLDWTGREGPVEQQHLVRRIADDVDGHARDQHLHDALALFREITRSARGRPQLLRTGEQPPGDDRVASDLDDDREEIKQCELGVFIRDEVVQVSAGKPQDAKALGEVGRGSDEGVEKSYWEGEYEDARPDDGDHRLYPAPTAVDVSRHRVDDGDVSATKKIQR